MVKFNPLLSLHLLRHLLPSESSAHPIHLYRSVESPWHAANKIWPLGSHTSHALLYQFSCSQNCAVPAWSIHNESKAQTTGRMFHDISIAEECEVYSTSGWMLLSISRMPCILLCQAFSVGSSKVMVLAEVTNRRSPFQGQEFMQRGTKTSVTEKNKDFVPWIHFHSSGKDEPYWYQSRSKAESKRNR